MLVWQDKWEGAKQMFFPSVELGLAVGAMVMRMTRSCLLDVLGREYVRTARAKGLTERAVIGRHALRNAVIPVVTLLGLQFGYLLGGTVVVEEIFSLPGIGRLVLRSISQRDFPLVQGILLVAGVIVVVLNVCVDACYAYLDPRLRQG
jgi:ABC-type dipeptide/oligopeptide/nickel transport system permease component